ncbi:hypothetical protein BKA62DRAFT_215990 [Auriculariales sp. MPI-PUGE-AT-0066]|nr:hypothetical protein BKA62DRAFT_215990 [Auriculariales sp. MPI-PUGE-AT-0066]
MAVRSYAAPCNAECESCHRFFISRLLTDQSLPIGQPPALHPMPAGPTALSPSPYMVGHTRSTAIPPRVRPRAHTNINVPVSSMVVVHPYGSPFPSPIPSPSPTTPVAWGYMPPPQRMIPPIPVPTYIPSLPPPRRSTRAAPPRLHNLPTASMQGNSQYFPQTSPPTVLSFTAPATARDLNWKNGHVHARSMDSGASPALTVSDVLSDWSMSEPPSAWATPASHASRRLSGATCTSSHTFGY